MISEIVQRLGELGFAEYESRAYIQLLRAHPATPYEVAKETGIPSSKIYGVLGKLSEKGMVTQFNEGAKRLVSPLPMATFLSDTRSRVEATLDSLEKDLSNLQKAPAVSLLWQLDNGDSVIEKARQMIFKAENELLLSLWPTEFYRIKPDLEQALGRGVKVALVLFGEGEMDGVQLYRHPIGDTIMAEKGERTLILLADGLEALLGSFNTSRPGEGTWSQNTSFVSLAQEYVKHDIYILKIVDRFDRNLLDRFGQGYFRLRDVFTDTEEENGSNR